MKKLVIMAMAVVITCLVLGNLYAQQGPRPERRGQRGGDMLIRLADTNADGQVSQKEWMAIFKKTDGDGDGILSEEEIVKLQEAAMEEARKAMFNRWDANGDGSISKDEFGGRDEMFKNIDSNGDGKVSLEELNNSWRGRREGRPPRPADDQEKPSEDPPSEKDESESESGQ